MPARVNINIPPRVIESARAAQYANREALDGRMLTDKIKAKVQARRAAVLQQQPGAAPDRGDDSPPARDPLKWRIWRKRRPSKSVDVGVGWLHIGHNYTVTSNSAVNYDPTWSNGVPGSTWDNLSGPTTRRIGSIGSIAAKLELVVTLGTRSGDTWNRFRYSLDYSQSFNSYNDETRFLYYAEGPNGQQIGINGRREENYQYVSQFHYTKLWYSLLPAGQSALILVVTIAKFAITGFKTDTANQASTDGAFVLQSTKQVSFVVTESSITELTHPIPAFMQKQINNELTANSSIGTRVLLGINEPNIAIDPAISQQAIGTYMIGVNLKGVASSVTYEGIASDGSYSAVSAQQAKASYASYSGNSEIPVLRYKRDDPLATSTPTTEKGLFGIIPAASVTAPITSGMLAAGLDDELEQRPGPNAENQPEPVGLVITYDYHGGTYCRSRLAALGITLP